jgi:hypothetical protein
MEAPFTKDAFLGAPILLALQARSAIAAAQRAALDAASVTAAQRSGDAGEATTPRAEAGASAQAPPQLEITPLKSNMPGEPEDRPEDEEAAPMEEDAPALTPQAPESFQSIDKISAALQLGLPRAAAAELRRAAPAESSSATEGTSGTAPMLQPAGVSAFIRDPLVRKVLSSDRGGASAPAVAAGGGEGAAASIELPAALGGKGEGSADFTVTPRGGGLRNAVAAAGLHWPPVAAAPGCRSVHLDVHGARQAMARAFVSTRSLSDTHSIFISLLNDPSSRLPLAKSANAGMLTRFRAPGRAARQVPGPAAPAGAPPSPPGLSRLVSMPSMASVVVSTMTGAGSLMHSVSSVGLAADAGPSLQQAQVSIVEPSDVPVELPAARPAVAVPGASASPQQPPGASAEAPTAQPVTTDGAAGASSDAHAPQGAGDAHDAPAATTASIPPVTAARPAAQTRAAVGEKATDEPAASVHRAGVLPSGIGNAQATPPAAPASAAAPLPPERVAADAPQHAASTQPPASAPPAIALHPGLTSAQASMQPTSVAEVAPSTKVREVAMQCLAVPEAPQLRPPVPRRASHIPAPNEAPASSSGRPAGPAPLLPRAPALLADLVSVKPAAPSWGAPARKRAKPAAGAVPEQAGATEDAGAAAAPAQTSTAQAGAGTLASKVVLSSKPPSAQQGGGAPVANSKPGVAVQGTEASGADPPSA